MPSNWEPPEDQISLEVREHCVQDLTIFSRPRIFPRAPILGNISQEQRCAIEELQCNNMVVIKPADKGSAIVIMDRVQYIREAERQLTVLEHYIPLVESIQMETRVLQIPILDELKCQGYITERQRKFLLGPDFPRPRLFYLLPKVHKKMESWPIEGIPPGRPIISDCDSESYHIAKFIDFYLNPISQRHNSYIKDTYDFIEKIHNIRVPDHTFLFTIDVVSLYTNIDTELGLQAVAEAFQRYPDSERPDEALLKLLKLGLTRNDFLFNGKYYLQVHGTAMGKTFAPSYANIYMAAWETTVLPKCPQRPLVYLRYLDDIFGLWSHGMVAFQNFLEILNNHHKSIKVTSNIQSKSVEFLDTEVFFREGERGEQKGLATRVFFKTTDTHALLHKASYHPKHTFKGIVKSQLIRFRRICTFEEDVEKATNILFTALRKRGYAKRFLRGIKAQVKHSFQSRELNRQRLENFNIVPFVQTFHKNGANWNKKIRNHFSQLQLDRPEFGNLRLISAFRRNKNLQDLLVRTSFEPPLPKIAPPHSLTHFITNSLTGKGAPVSQQIFPDTPNVVYAIKCLVCGILYIGETKLTMRTRFKQHEYCVRTKKDRLLYNHFQMHPTDQLRMVGLQSNPSWDKTQRLNAERSWILKLNTITPWGLNEKW